MFKKGPLLLHWQSWQVCPGRNGRARAPRVQYNPRAAPATATSALACAKTVDVDMRRHCRRTWTPPCALSGARQLPHPHSTYAWRGVALDTFGTSWNGGCGVSYPNGYMAAFVYLGPQCDLTTDIR
jgi:hypothetical protein